MMDPTLLNRGYAGSTWGNLGLWTHAKDYPAACEALAMKLAEEAQLRPGLSVLDVGFGYGDQLLLWKNCFAVGHMTGVEADAAGLANARRKLAAFNDVTFQMNDDGAATVHGSFDRVLALDCAYHFAPRSAFFKQASHALKEGGMLALTDIVLADGEQASQHKHLANVCNIPKGNLLTQQSYESSLVEWGFTNIRFTRLDHSVLYGFSQFALRHLCRHASAAFNASGLQILVTALAAAWLCRHARIHYVLITATRAPTGDACGG